ncbi:MAG: GPR endopeptidase [Oscillospiraceae bacterium]|nr:GPR endopeptidase [Oscillospiraceae bacterium]
MSIRTDLALEACEFAGEIVPEGVNKQIETREGVTVTTVSITDDHGAKILGKPIGKYITFEIDSLKNISENFEGEVETITEGIASLLPKEGLILVAGLGNSDITPDALGPHTIDQTLATRHIATDLQEYEDLQKLRPVAAISPGVMGRTGIETAEIIHCLCNEIEPKAIIVVDALASRSVDRLGRTVQVSDTGISPGSGVQNSRKEISQETLGLPVISVGVPTVVDMTTVAYELLGEGMSSEKVSERGRTMMVTPREIDTIIKQAAKLVACSINKALQPMLSMEEIVGLTG